MIKLSNLKKNPNNPREVVKDKFDKLKTSIATFPEMMELRPIIVDDNNVILGGNMRYSALKALGYKEVPELWVKFAKDLTEDQKREFIIKDNVGFGVWDYDSLANNWDINELTQWGMDLWDSSEIEEEEEIESTPEEKEDESTIKIKVNIDNLKELNELISFWEQRKAYVAGMLLEKLRIEKSKLK